MFVFIYFYSMLVLHLVMMAPSTPPALQEKCLGPGVTSNEERLNRAWERASKAFNKDYNDKLFTGLLVLSLGAVVLFRFLVRVHVLEAVGWAGFIFLEIYPHLHSGSIYDTRGWALTVKLWEGAILLLFGFSGSGLVWAAVVLALIGWRLRKRTASRRKKKQTTSDGFRDLDV